jgi:hypothetical protein
MNLTSSLKSCIIRNCHQVSIDNTFLSELELDLLNIIGVGELLIKRGTLKKIDELFFEDIETMKVGLGAFNGLEANKIIFRKVNFSASQEHIFHHVKSTLEYMDSDLTKVTSIQISEPVKNVGFYSCQMGQQLDLKINTCELFAMSDNYFQSFLLTSNYSFNIRYNGRIELGSNWISNESGMIRLPQLKASSSAFAINVHVSPLNMEKIMDFLQWWASFKFTDMQPSSVYWSTCSIHRVPAYWSIRCNSAFEMESFINSDRFNRTVFAPTSYSNAKSIYVSTFIILFLICIHLLWF